MEDASHPESDALPHMAEMEADKTPRLEDLEIEMAAMAAIDKPSPWTRHMIKLYLILIPGYIVSTFTGFDGSLMGGINGIPSYLATFQLKQASVGTGIVFMVPNVASFIALPCVSPLSRLVGRRWTMFIGCIIMIIGVAVQTSAPNMAAFIAGRFVIGLGAVLPGVVAPAFVVEWTHPLLRGTQAGLYNVCWYLGSIIASWAAYGSNLHLGGSSWAWRLPVLMQAVMPAIICSTILFCPESPRWLVANDRHEEALKLMVKYHGAGDESSEIVKLEYEEMQAQIRSDVATESMESPWWDYREIFSTKENRYRIFVVLCMSLFGQVSGNNILSYFIVIMLSQAGINSANTQLLINALNPVTCMLASIAGALTLDRFGRRKILIWSTSICIILMSAMTATTAVSDQGHHAAAYAMVVCMFLFGVVFSYGYTPLQSLYPSECLDTKTRIKGLALNSFFMGLIGIYNTFVPPIALGKIGWHFYFVYIIWDVIEVLIIYFFFVETAGHTLEELALIFSAQNPVKASLRKS